MVIGNGTEDSTQSISRLLLVLAAPLIVQNLIHVVNLLVDTFWLGRLSEDAVAAVGLTIPLISVVAAGITLVAVGTQISLAQRVGAEHYEAATHLAITGILTAALIGLSIAVVGILSAERVIGVLTSDPTVQRLSILYLVTLLTFYPLAFVSDTIENAFIGWGATRIALYINGGMVMTNIVLDPILIFGLGPVPAFGVQGAALATGIGITFGLVVGVLFAYRSRTVLPFNDASLSFDPGYAREILTVGAPLSGQRLTGDSVRVLMMGFVSLTGGAAGIAAYTIGERVATLAIVPARGLQQAAQTMVAQYIGASKPNEAYRTTLVGVLFGTIGLALLGLFQWLYAGLIVDIFVPNLTIEGRELSITFLRILALSYWAIGGTYLLLAGFNGVKRTRTSFVIDVLKYWGIRFPIALIAIPGIASFSILGFTLTFGWGLGIEAIFWAVTISNLLAFFGAIGYFVYTYQRGMFRQSVRTATASLGDG